VENAFVVFAGVWSTSLTDGTYGPVLFESKAHSTISVAHFTGCSQFLNRKIQEI